MCTKIKQTGPPERYLSIPIVINLDPWFGNDGVEIIDEENHIYKPRIKITWMKPNMSNQNVNSGSDYHPASPHTYIIERKEKILILVGQLSLKHQMII